MNRRSRPRSETPFWVAVSNNDLQTARRLLEADPTLVSMDFRADEDRDPHTDGFPLHKASAAGHEEMAELLLEYGADVDARSPTKEQRELGMPIWLAVDRRRYSLANLLLDHGADIGAYAWAKDYLWPDHYGYGESRSSVESMMDLAELLIRFGFNELDRVNPSGATPLSLAQQRKNHPGLPEYIAYLISRTSRR